MNEMDYSNRDIRNNFSDINRVLTMNYSSGSVELQMGRYVTEDDINSLEEKIRYCSLV
jgi:hypothetical protein